MRANHLHRRRLRHPVSSPSHGAKEASKSWAERHAPLATIIAGYSTLAAVVIAGVGYYFTVIPLYQKAAVDEQLARREVELKQLEERLSIARTQTYELSRARLLDGLAIGASFECAGNAYRPLPTDGKTQGGQAKQSVEELLAPSITDCLARFTDRARKSNKLTESDIRKLAAATNELGAKLDQQRLAAIERVRGIPAKARQDPRILEESTLDRRFLEIIQKGLPFSRRPSEGLLTKNGGLCCMLKMFSEVSHINTGLRRVKRYAPCTGQAFGRGSA